MLCECVRAFGFDGGATEPYPSTSAPITLLTSSVHVNPSNANSVTNYGSNESEVYLLGVCVFLHGFLFV